MKKLYTFVKSIDWQFIVEWTLLLALSFAVWGTIFWAFAQLVIIQW